MGRARRTPIATTPDGISAYGALPTGTRIGAWVRMNAQPGAHRMRSCWEAVLLRPPDSRISNRGPGMVPDVLVEPMPNHSTFRGAKPRRWVEWVLECMTYDPDTDEVIDLFPGSGAVSDALAAHQPRLLSCDLEPRGDSPEGQ
jgi:hypothetical protein